MLHLAALHAAARPLAIAALAIAGLAGPGLAVAHGAATVPAASHHVEACPMAAGKSLSMQCPASPHGVAVHGVGMGMAAGDRH